MVLVPFSKFDHENKCLMRRHDGCEDIEWIRENFGDPVEITQNFIRNAYLRYRGISVCGLLDAYVPDALKAEHLRYVQEAKVEYRDAIGAAENGLLRTGNVSAYDQAVSQAFLRHRGRRFGALEGAFTPQFLPYY